MEILNGNLFFVRPRRRLDRLNFSLTADTSTVKKQEAAYLCARQKKLARCDSFGFLEPFNERCAQWNPRIETWFERHQWLAKENCNYCWIDLLLMWNAMGPDEWNHLWFLRIWLLNRDFFSSSRSVKLCSFCIFSSGVFISSKAARLKSVNPGNLSFSRFRWSSATLSIYIGIYLWICLFTFSAVGVSSIVEGRYKADARRLSTGLSSGTTSCRIDRSQP